MLFGLKRQLTDIENRGLDEQDVYRRADNYRRPTTGTGTRPGAVLCPICGTSRQKFLPFGLAGRPNAMCPGCGSIERHRLMWLFLTRRTDILRKRHRILHTAPEPCLEGPLRTLHGRRYVTVDAFNPGADLQADLKDLPMSDDTFDVVLTSHVLEHIQDDDRAIAELVRVLKPGGWALILVPYDPGRPTREDPGLTTPAARMAAYGHPYHYRIYGNDLPSRLESHGLSVRVYTTKDILSGHHRRRYRVNRNNLFYCRKRRDGS